MSQHSQPSMSGPSSQPAMERNEAAMASRDSSISFNLGRLEPWVAFSIAIYTAWVAVFSFPQVPAIWCFVIYAGLIGQWCRVRPPRHQFELFVRGVALVAGAYVLHTHTSNEIGGPTGVFFFWLSITTLYYAFMLKPLWAGALVSLAMVEYIVSWSLVGGSGIMSMIATGGSLAIFPMFVAMRFGAAMRRPDEAMEQSRIDSASGLYNKAGLLEYGGEMLQACRREKKAVTLAIFDCPELREMRGMYGRKVARRLTGDVVGRFVALTADRGLAARTGATQFSVLLFGRNREKALQAITREFGDPSRIELAVGDTRVILQPRLLLETVGQEKTSLSDLHDELSADLDELRMHVQQMPALPVLVVAAPKSDGFSPTVSCELLAMPASSMPARLAA